MVRIYAINCEMVYNKVSRVTLVDEKFNRVLDTRNMPGYAVLLFKEIINEEDVLVGFNVQKDLQALGFSHSNIKDMATHPALLESGEIELLKNLAFQELGLHILEGDKYNSVYYAKAAMDIYKKYSF
ncbi:unnamed protein product [Pieris macdunnoughi]|uniref:Uncharacterized protein n=1 Tax=Pieris macdunnoughi TaxID=345717 RepID=A0A821VUA9_9NEOP|nr:unnamed protein product [Pieris macdunnoughi]